MGSQTHTPGAGLRPGALGKRNWPAIMETRRQLEADIRPAVYVRPLGGGIHLVKNASNDQAYRVGSAAGAQFTAGQAVFLASHTGSGPDVIVAQPPLGQRGTSAAAVAAVTRPTRFELDEPAPGAAQYYAFSVDFGAGPDIIASVYDGASWLSDRGTIAGDDAGLTQLIRSDPGGFVGPGSLLWFAELRTWDVEGEASHVYSVPAGWLTTVAVYDDGFVWWMESEEAQHGSPGTRASFFRLRRARADFSDPTTIATIEAEHVTDLDIVDDATIEPQGFALLGDDGAAYGAFTWLDNVNNENSGTINIRATRAGGIAVAAVGSPPFGNKGDRALPSSLNAGVTAPRDSGSGLEDGLAVIADDGAVPAEIWPLTTSWDGEYLYVTASGVSASLYGAPDTDFRLIQHALVAAGATPSLVVVPEVHPTTGAQPDAFFPKE